MKRLLALTSLTLLLAACMVDTTGIVPESTKQPRGNAQSVVLVAEYADLQCPACRAAQTKLVQPLYDKYKTQVRFEYHHFPIRSLHRYTMDLAEASECVADQGKFWEYVDLAFARQDDLKKGSAKAWGEELVADKDLYDRCVSSHIKNAAVTAEYDAGVAAGVRGTPTFFVNGKQVQATLEDLTAAIDAQLKGAAQRL
jgi:protein-disulfide isomerase